MTWYVERDGAGNIKGARRAPEPGVADEELADNDAEVIAFLNAVDLDGVARAVRKAQFLETADGEDLLARLQNATPAQIDSWIDNNVTSVASARAVFKAILKILAAEA